jgi:predicted nucleotidyltransferase
MLSLHPPAETTDGKGPDFQAHEARKFAHLLLKGNPGVVECLFTEVGVNWGPEWARLLERRKMFLNTQTLKQYLGYCRGQLQRMDAGTRLHTKGGEFNTKWAYHMIRLAHDAERISKGQAPLVFKTGDEKALLMDVRAGKWGPDQLASMYREIEERIDAGKPWPIPDSADENVLNEWLWSLYFT